MSRKKESHTRETLRRLITILALLNANRLPHSINEILAEEEVQGYLDPTIDIESQKRMIRRDMKDLIALDFIEKVVEKNKKAYSFRVNSDKREVFAKLLNLNIDQEMLEALLLSQNIFRYFDNTHLKTAIDELNSSLTQAFSLSSESPGETPPTIQVKLGPTSIFTESKGDILSDASYAISSCSKIDITYKSIGQSHNHTMKNLEPHRLILQDDNFYLLVFNSSDDPLQHGFRTLNLMRFKTLNILSDTFQRRDSSEIDEKIMNSFGILTSGKPENITITFSKEDKAMEKRLLEKQWHHSATIKEFDTTIELSLFVNINDEFARWILSWGNSIVSVTSDTLKEILHRISKSSW